MNAAAPPPAGRRERLYARLAGLLTGRAATLALARGDRHESDHLRAAIRAGNTGPGSHDDGCAAAGRVAPRLHIRVHLKRRSHF